MIKQQISFNKGKGPLQGTRKVGFPSLSVNPWGKNGAKHIKIFHI